LCPAVGEPNEEDILSGKYRIFHLWVLGPCYKLAFASTPLSQASLSPRPHIIMPPYDINALVESAQSNLAQFSSFVMLGQTVIIGTIHPPSFEVWPELTYLRTVLLIVGAGTGFHLAYRQWAAVACPTEDEDRALLLSRPRVRPVSRIAFPVAGVNSGRVYTCPTAARPRAPALLPSALVPVSNEDS